MTSRGLRRTETKRFIIQLPNVRAHFFSLGVLIFSVQYVVLNLEDKVALAFATVLVWVF